MSAARLIALGDSCVAMQFSETIEEAVNQRCIAVAEELDRRRLCGVLDAVPTYNAVTVYFDPLTIDRRSLDVELHRVVDSAPPATNPTPRLVEIPVSYGGASGPDLQAVAEFAGASADEVVSLHTRKTYRVYMLGFLPGFAYMGSVDARIAMPRLETPRMRVTAGSVGIARAQTGIYPCDTPGGWRIIGRTLQKMFDPSASEPCFLKAGDSVRFVAQ